MHKLSVGELYVPGKTSWPEAVEYNYTLAGHELRLFLGRPSVSEVRAVRLAPLRLVQAGTARILSTWFRSYTGTFRSFRGRPSGRSCRCCS
jgi:hypothetical protein